VKKTDSTPLRDKVAYLGVFLALALICSYVESLIPFYFGIPGVKLGLTNIVVVLMLYCVGTKEAFAISMLRIVLAGFCSAICSVSYTALPAECSAFW
jgi:heptaprenyl diphosphate synthase